MNRDAYVPEPMTCHPAYEGNADGIRQLIETRAQVVVPDLRASAAFIAVDAEKPITPAVLRTRVLTVRKCAGPAPFVGDPRFTQGAYVWRVGIDELGRHVAGPAELILEHRWGRP